MRARSRRVCVGGVVLLAVAVVRDARGTRKKFTVNTMSASIPQLITQSLTDDPQSSNEIHARLQTILGEGAPGLASVQSVLSQKGETLGVKIRISKGIVCLLYTSPSPRD